MPKLVEPIVGSSLQLKFHTKKFKHFIVRWTIRQDTGNVVYQFYSEDPDIIEDALVTGRGHNHKPFDRHFKDAMLAAFRSIVPEAKIDAAYVALYNSHSVILRGYADSPGLRSLLEPTFEAIDKEIEAHRAH